MTVFTQTHKHTHRVSSNQKTDIKKNNQIRTFEITVIAIELSDKKKKNQLLKVLKPDIANIKFTPLP